MKLNEGTAVYHHSGLICGIFALVVTAMGLIAEGEKLAAGRGENSATVVQGDGAESSKVEVKRGGFTIIERQDARGNVATIIQHE